MREDFEIELQDETPADGESIQLPVNFVQVGEVSPEDVKVYIRQALYKELEAYSAADTSVERGSILLGRYSEAMGKRSIVISDSIEARHTDASAATLTFTHETWTYVHETRDRDFPDLRILGWHHTHPGYGVFLSNYDTFIQENFFDLPFQVAYVIDPVQELRGFFQWKDGAIKRLDGFFVYDEIGEKISVEEKRPKASAEKKQAGKLPILLILLAVLIGTCLGTVLGITVANRALREVKETQAQTQTKLGELEQTAAAQTAEIGRLQAEADRLAAEAQKPAAEAPLPEQTADAEPAPACTGVHFLPYEVQAGDGLVRICDAAGIDYATWKDIILAVNGIADPNVIYRGQLLLLPTAVN